MVSADSRDRYAENVVYGKFREDKEAEPGFSREIVHADVAPEFYDNLDGLPNYQGLETNFVALL